MMQKSPAGPRHAQIRGCTRRGACETRPMYVATEIRHMRFSLPSALVIAALVAPLAGCDPAAFPLASGTAPETVPEAVRAVAAPNQNVDSARLLPEDGCWWYEYAGPVETTLLPLLTAEGRPICSAASVEPGTEA